MDVYVSPAGNDSWDGSLERPFATLNTARDALRAARTPRRRIVVGGGDYYDAALALGPQDSGLTVEAAEGETPQLYGGRRISNWERHGDHFVAARLRGVRTGQWDFRTLIVNGEVAPRARLPRAGVLLHDSRFDGRWMSTSAGGWDRKPTEAQLRTMRYRRGDLGPWLDLRNAEFTVYHQWDESLVGAAMLDDASRTITFTSPCGHPPGAFAGCTEKGRWYVVWNVREGMHEPGQWYLDRRAGQVVYWPREGEDMASAHVVAPASFSAIQIAGEGNQPARDITIRGLKIEATTTRLEAAGFGAARCPAAVALTGACADITLEGLTVANVGGHAVRAVSGKGEPRPQRVRISNCAVRNTGGPGIRVHGDACTVADCMLDTVGLVYPSAIGMTVSGPDCVVEHNEVSNCPYSAITGSGERTRFEHNRLRNYMTQLDDGAAIYVFGGKRVVYRGNVARGASGRMAHAYYLDEQCEDCLVEGNLAVNTRWPSHNHMARRCTIRRNVFLDDEDSQLTFMRCEGFTVEQNVIVSGGTLSLRAPRDGIAAMPGNILFSRTGQVDATWYGKDNYEKQAAELLAPRDGTMLADPLLTEPGREAYAFAEGSPAHALGIPPQDFSQAGRR